MATGGGLPKPTLGFHARRSTWCTPGVEHEVAEAIGSLPVPPLGRRAEPALGTFLAPMLQQVRQSVGAEDVPRLRGLAQPVVRGGFVTALTVVPTQRV